MAEEVEAEEEEVFKMKLYLKQKELTLGEKFKKYDENKNIRWYTKSNTFSFGRKMHIYQADGQKSAVIKQKVLAFVPLYSIKINDIIYNFTSKITLSTPHNRLVENNWDIFPLSNNYYEVFSGDELILSLYKKKFTFGHSYELNMTNCENELLAICISLVINSIKTDTTVSAQIFGKSFG